MLSGWCIHVYRDFVASWILSVPPWRLASLACAWDTRTSCFWSTNTSSAWLNPHSGGPIIVVAVIQPTHPANQPTIHCDGTSFSWDGVDGVWGICIAHVHMHMHMHMLMQTSGATGMSLHPPGWPNIHYSTKLWFNVHRMREILCLLEKSQRSKIPKSFESFLLSTWFCPRNSLIKSLEWLSRTHFFFTLGSDHRTHTRIHRSKNGEFIFLRMRKRWTPCWTIWLSLVSGWALYKRILCTKLFLERGLKTEVAPVERW